MRFLFIGAHCDDVELCCGSSIAKLNDHSHSILAISLSKVYGDMDNTREFEKSMDILKCGFDCYNFETRFFDSCRQHILQKLVSLQSFYEPDFVFTHSANDIHQDHKVVGEESLRVFKKCNLITYMGEWNQLTSESNYYIEASDDNMAKKIESMSCYTSQQHRPYFDRQFTYSRAILNGAKIGVKYAEAFRIVNMRG